MHDLRGLGYCPKGVRRVAIQNDLDFKSFLKQGISLEELEQKCGNQQFYIEIKDKYGERELNG